MAKLSNEQIADIVLRVAQAVFPPQGEMEISVDGDATWGETGAKGHVTITVTWNTAPATPAE